MLGAIIGDVIGSVYEFHPTDRVDFEPFSEKCFFTDDSVLTFATAEVLMNGGDYGEAYRRWGREYPRRGYGGRFAQWLRDDSMGPYNSFGNGSAMRVAPVGWAFNSLEETLAEAERSAICTHNHLEGVKGAQVVAALIFWARQGKDKDFMKDYAEREFSYDLSATIEETREKAVFDETCQVSVPEALIAFFEAKDFEETIRYSISLGADADTQACIAGGIAEAYWHEIPKEWEEFVIGKLDNKTRTLLANFREKYNVQ